MRFFAMLLCVAACLPIMADDALTFDDRDFDPSPIVNESDSVPEPTPLPVVPEFAPEEDTEPPAINEFAAAGFDMPAFVDNRIESQFGPYTDRLARLESKMANVEGQMMTLTGRVDRVEAQLRAILTVRSENGTTSQSTVEIDHVSGYGDFEVPAGGRVVAINGVPVVRSTMASSPASTVRYMTTEFTAQPVMTTSSPRTVRIFPRLFRSSSNSTCRIVNGVMTCN